MANEILKKLRELGYRITSQRRIILEAISSSDKYLTPDELHSLIKKKHPSIGRVTVYRTLEMLNKNNLLCRVNIGSAARNYLIKRPREHHHHIICSGCGKVADFNHCLMDRLSTQISEQTSFDIESHIFEVYGLCGECKQIKGK